MLTTAAEIMMHGDHLIGEGGFINAWLSDVLIGGKRAAVLMTIASTTFTEHQLFAINSNMEEVWKIKKAPMSESRAMIIESDYYIGCEAKQEITAQFDESHTEVDRRTFWQKFLPEFSTTVASLVHR